MLTALVASCKVLETIDERLMQCGISRRAFLLAGRPAIEVLADVAGKAAAIIAIGSCATWGGIPSADPNPTGAVGVADLLPKKTIVNIPGCPPNPYTLLGVVLQFADSGTLPELDAERRPKFAYDRDIHEHCP